MIYWQGVNAKLNLFLDDTDGRQFAIPFRVDAWNWAQRAFCAHTPRAKSCTLQIDAGKRSALLPSDFFAIDSIYDRDSEVWWRSMRKRPGDVMYTDEDINEFWVWGDHVHLETSVEYTAYDLTMYYWAYYPEVEYKEENDELVYTQAEVWIPEWAELALVHLTTATLMMPGEVFSADINQFKIRVESGTPVMNPRADSTKFHLWWYMTLLDMYPAARKSVVQ